MDSFSANIEKLSADYPRFHQWGGEDAEAGGFEEIIVKTADFLKNCGVSKPKIIETGAGLSTLTFLLSDAAKLTTVCPEADLIDRITQYCTDKDIDLHKWDVALGASEFVLPSLTRDSECFGSYDIALIDGGHNFPTVFADLFHFNRLLRKGGYLILDDLNLYSCDVAGEFLDAQPEYETVMDLGSKTRVFKKTMERFDFGDWVSSPYVVLKSN